jgi:eukaryotic-like serine/threonine-protein kinase
MQTEARKRTSERLGAGTNIPSYDCGGLTAGCVIDGRFRLGIALDRQARVWRATDNANRQLVLKTGPEPVIEHEFEILSALDHPNIVRTMGYVNCEAGSFIVLENLSGGDLVSLAGLSPEYWLQPIAQLIHALGYLHDRGFVHRDVKARNVLLDASNATRLIDFGSALPVGSCWTDGGTTRSMVSPERGDEPVSIADDVFALTCLLYEMLYGAPPRAASRKPVPAWVNPLVRLVDAGVDAAEAGVRPGLDRFSAVVELLMARGPDHQ